MLPVLAGILFMLASAASSLTKEAERLRSASTVVTDFGAMKENIPQELIEQSKGIVIIPRLINAGLGIGGKRGRGVAMVKLDDGRWSDPVFVTLTGGSIGPQIGIQSVDLILVFRHKSVLTRVKNGDFTIGGDASAAVGPVGRSTSANTDYKLEAEVYSYSRSRGLFAGISINGANLSIDKDADAEYYGRDMGTRDIFETAKSNTEAVKALKESLRNL